MTIENNIRASRLETGSPFYGFIKFYEIVYLYVIMYYKKFALYSASNQPDEAATWDLNLQHLTDSSALLKA